LELSAPADHSHVWTELREELRRIVGDSTFELWLAPLRIANWTEREIALRAPVQTHTWVARRFGALIERCAQALLDSTVKVTVAAEDSACGTASAPARSSAENAQPAGGAPVAEQAFNPRYSFEQFIIGDGNRLAHAAALAVAELPGAAYNPLFLHGPPGSGKTHLLHAIGSYVRAYGGTTLVRYTTVEAFTNHFIGSLSAREGVARFKRLYRDADVLLIDDVQFLASKARTEEEFFHTFNALYEAGRQLVLTCDRLPDQLLTIQERLRERFESGLVAQIQPPDQATRLTILRKRVALDRIPLQDEAVLELIASRITDNIRALEGALIRIVAHQSLTRRPLGLELAREVLDQLHPPPPAREVSLSLIKRVVAERCAVTVEQLESPARAAHVAWPRQLAIHLSRQLTDAPLAEIGNAFGGRSHATVLYASKRVEERVRTDAQRRAELDSLRILITEGQHDRGC
jgi:chromosomal replication initiator protein